MASCLDIVLWATDLFRHFWTSLITSLSSPVSSTQLWGDLFRHFWTSLITSLSSPVSSTQLWGYRVYQIGKKSMVVKKKHTHN